MGEITAVAQNTFRRVMRNLTLYVLLFFCLALVASGSLYGTLSQHREQELMTDGGLALVSIVSMLVAVFVGPGEIAREREGGTATTLLSTPIGRDRFLIGTFLGVVAIGVFNIAVLTIGTMGMVYLKIHSVDANLALAGAMNCAELLVLVSAGVLFSTFASETTASILTFAFFLVGHSSAALGRWAAAGEGGAAAAAGLLYRLLPDLGNVAVKNEMARGIVVPREMLVYGISYAVCLSVALLVLATIIFRRIDVD